MYEEYNERQKNLIKSESSRYDMIIKREMEEDESKRQDLFLLNYLLKKYPDSWPVRNLIREKTPPKNLAVDRKPKEWVKKTNNGTNDKNYKSEKKPKEEKVPKKEQQTESSETGFIGEDLKLKEDEKA